MNLAILETSTEKFIKKLASEKKSKHTITNYSSSIGSLIKYVRMHKGNDEFDIKETVFEYIDSISPNYSSNTINTRRIIIKSFVNYLADRGYIEESFSRRIKLLRRDSNKRKEVLEPFEIEKLLEIASSEISEAAGYNVYHKVRNRLLLIMLLFTGMRRSEIACLKWSDVNTRTNEISVVGKGNKTRVVPLRKEIRYELMDFKELTGELEGRGYSMNSKYIFGSEHRNKRTKEKDGHVNPKTIEVIIGSLVKKSGITKKITPHNLRHNFASYALKSGMSVPTLSGILGHASPDITMKIYAHEISKEEREKQMSKLDFGI
ncbi:tyrosine recombinase XerC [Peptoclostridium acidaminophilum DSM 3953]|uniref:Tyrosine recombinase XerC n=1 Tax=Peptoclostridium acidaminophilum DSM 3953 TaxID=1286171 RepID=W8T6T0_PEPAC|nr:tyrosine-type recombinase/integrase [Peptoclostridium acidaminophilum]AHM56585.1 tyrosine recombinase XerC [Peptoclostridium acidaminophilum DSM 3953]